MKTDIYFLVMEQNDNIILDDYLFVSGLDDMKSKINLYGFPTKFIIEKTELKESIVYKNKYIIMKESFVINYTKKNKNIIYLFDKKLQYSEENTVLNIIPKYESIDCKNEELHIWNVYVDGIKNIY